MNKILIVCMGFFFAISCGNEGNRAPKKPKAPLETEEEKEELELRTRVAFLKPHYPVMNSPRCLTENNVSSLQVDASTITIDGALLDWPKHIERYIDLDNQKDGIGVDSFMLGITPDKVLMGFELKGSPELRLSLIGLSIKNNKLIDDALDSFRIAEGILEVYDDGWIPLPKNSYTLSRNDGGLEVSLDRRFVGEGLSWPIWGMQIDTTAGGENTDSLEVITHPSLIDRDQEFSVLDCTNWIGRNLAMKARVIDTEESEFSSHAIRLGLEALNITGMLFGTSALNSPLISMVAGNFDGVQTRRLTSLAMGSPIILNTKHLHSSFDSIEDHLFVSDVVHQIISRFFSSENANVKAMASSFEVGVILSYFKKFYGPSLYYDIFAFDSPLGSSYLKSEGGQFLAEIFSAKQIIALWNAIKSLPVDNNPWEELKASLKEIATDESQHKMGIELFESWKKNFKKGQFQSKLLKDSDQDGLLDVTEIILGSSPKKIDTDDDGWTDFSELFSGKDATNQALAPRRIAADGLFQDWLNLIPQRVHTDKGNNHLCHGHSDIIQFSAIASKDYLMVGALPKSRAKKDKEVRWEITITDKETNSTTLLRGKSNESHYSIIDKKNDTRVASIPLPFSIGSRHLEWWVSKYQINGNEKDLRDSQLEVSIRTVSIDGKDFICDETEVVKPLLID